MGVALFDIDRTLIAVNSANLWVKHEWREGRLSALDAVRGGFWLIRYRLGMDAGMEDIYRDAVGRLAGEREEVIAERTRVWFEREVAPTVRPGALQAIAAHRAAGDRLVICTSSSPYAAECAARAWGFEDRIHTSFEVVDGVFTGNVAAFAYGDHKHARAVAWAAANGVDLAADATFYTDSVTDLKLLEAVRTPVAVNPDRPLRRIARARGWRVEDWGTP